MYARNKLLFFISTVEFICLSLSIKKKMYPLTKDELMKKSKIIVKLNITPPQNPLPPRSILSDTRNYK